MGRHGLAAAAACLVLAACGADTVVPPSSTGSAPLPPTASPAVATASPASSPTPVAAAPCEERALSFDPANLDLTGAWLGDDGGIYYIRQIAKTVWWSGMSDQSGPPDRLGRAWSNLAVGKIKVDRRSIWTGWTFRAATSSALGP